jgi:hypothetical protein
MPYGTRPICGKHVDRSVIALCLGHERLEITQIYLEVTLAMKEKALARASPPQGMSGATNRRPTPRLPEQYVAHARLCRGIFEALHEAG